MPKNATNHRHTWTLGPDFEGLHSITPGLHLVTFAPAGNAAGREGIWLRVAPGGVSRVAWDPALEAVATTDPLDAAAAAHLENQARAGRLRLGPYPQAHAAVRAGTGLHCVFKLVFEAGRGDAAERGVDSPRTGRGGDARIVRGRVAAATRG